MTTACEHESATILRSGAALLLAALACGPGARAAEPARSLQAPTLLEPGFLDGSAWGLKRDGAARRLGAEPGKAERGLAPEWFLAEGLSRLWRLKPGASDALERVEAGPGAWMIFHEGGLAGVLVREPYEQWHRLENQVRQRRGEPQERRDTVRPARGAKDAARRLQSFQWDAGRSRIVFLKAGAAHAPIDWYDPKTETALRVTILERMDGSSPPLYLGVFSEPALRALGSPRRRGGR